MQDDPLPSDEAPVTPPASSSDARPAPKAWRPVAGLAERPSRMALSDRMFFWFVYLGALALIGVGLSIIVFVPYHIAWKVGAILIGLGVGLFIVGGPSASQERGYRQ